MSAGPERRRPARRECCRIDAAAKKEGGSRGKLRQKGRGRTAILRRSAVAQRVVLPRCPTIACTCAPRPPCHVPRLR